ncbi:hypothetical protein SODALDRAFT_376361 [Sodiomyces alkalinus F11]|uniref:Uncharacterized protein n=1 Tax=Sodiomyces alkalinus (strain CBS 110278 / VKM F-3762 / F11) TaxID=1314773 RepID=A0A3N2Q1S9_SODAK|nr:hypothetical protein SODALDRAFT_376361 [Sodiomyces alkalinus F11]ROT40575.1 hypothetical protein SODALDRAFT_376361 [Sodiomyces alkalinus F11]
MGVPSAGGRPQQSSKSFPVGGPVGQRLGDPLGDVKWGSVGAAVRELALLNKRKSGEVNLGSADQSSQARTLFEANFCFLQVTEQEAMEYEADRDEFPGSDNCSLKYPCMGTYQGNAQFRKDNSALMLCRPFGRFPLISEKYLGDMDTKDSWEAWPSHHGHTKSEIPSCPTWGFYPVIDQSAIICEDYPIHWITLMVKVNPWRLKLLRDREKEADPDNPSLAIHTSLNPSLFETPSPPNVVLPPHIFSIQ